jgi:glutathione peroxidase
MAGAGFSRVGLGVCNQGLLSSDAKIQLSVRYIFAATFVVNYMSNLFYQFSAKSLQGKETSMESFKGKTILVVNTASKCGLTPQFEGLENLYQKYKNQGLVILGFPCNQFANQEPGDESSIAEGCLINYGVSFPMFAKIEVNGENAHPIYKYLKAELSGLFGGKIKWNFTKFLIDSEGKPVKRFGPIAKPEKIDNYLSKILR